MPTTMLGIPGARDATIEEDFDRLASRLAEEVDLELEEICARATRRLEEVFGHAVARGVPAERRHEQLARRLR